MLWQIPYRGRVWEFDDSRTTAAEARVMKRICEGATPAAITAARMEEDPDAWIAALAIARRRAGIPPEEVLDIDPNDLELSSIYPATAAKLREDFAARKAAGEEIDPEAEVALGITSPAEPEPAAAAAPAQ